MSRIRVLNLSRAFGAMRRSLPSFEMLNPRNLRSSVLLGPVTFLKLGKAKEAGFDPLTLLVHLLPVCIDILRRLSANGAEWVQIDEPCLVLDLDDKVKEALRQAYSTITRTLPNLKIMLATYFGALGDNLDLALSLPIAGLHVDLVRAPEQLETLSVKSPRGLVLSLGVIDGRNVWRADLPKLAGALKAIVAKRGADHIQIAPSCSLLHVPIDLEQETALDTDLKSWLAFSVRFRKSRRAPSAGKPRLDRR
jgi:5-methyltetrahydropteroyltriglutamate--homocysteine methyltransferase